MRSLMTSVVVLCVLVAASSEMDLPTENIVTRIKKSAEPYMQPQSRLDTAKQLIDHTTAWLGLEEVMSAAMATVFVGGVAHVLGVAAQLTSAVVTIISSPVAPCAIAILLTVTSLLQEQWALEGDKAVARSDKFFHAYQNHTEDWAKQATSQKVYESVDIIQYWMDLRKKEAVDLEKGVHQQVMLLADGYARQGYVGRWKAWTCHHCWNGACATEIEEDPLCGVEHHHITRASRKWNVVMEAIKVQLGYITKHLGDIRVTIAQTTSAKEEARANNKERMEEIKKKPGEVDRTRVPNMGAPKGLVDGSTYHWCTVLTAFAVFILICAYGTYRASWIHEDTWLLIRNETVPVLVSLLILLLWRLTSLITGICYVLLVVPAFTFFRFCVVAHKSDWLSKMRNLFAEAAVPVAWAAHGSTGVVPVGATSVYMPIRGDFLTHLGTDTPRHCDLVEFKATHSGRDVVDAYNRGSNEYFMNRYERDLCPREDAGAESFKCLLIDCIESHPTLGAPTEDNLEWRYRPPVSREERGVHMLYWRIVA